MSNWRKTLTQEHRLEKGKGEGDGGQVTNQQVADLAKQGVFKPYTLTTGTGTSQYTGDGQFSSNLIQPYTDIQQGALAGTQGLLPSITQRLGQAPDQFAFNTNVDQLTQDYFNQQAGLLQPQFEQQQQALKNNLFGSGRLGLSLAGSAVGAGGGMVNPDAFGLARAQSQTLADVGAQARQQALADAQARYGLESGVFGINQATQQQALQNQLAGAQQLFGFGTGVSEVENNLMKLGLSAEQARSVAASQAAQATASGISQQQQDSGGKGLLGSIVGAAGNIGAAYATGGGSLFGSAAGGAASSNFGNIAAGSIGGL